MGFTAVVEKEKVTKDGDVVRVVEEVHYPPDTTAGIFIVRNMDPGNWCDKQDINHSGGIEVDGKLGAIMVQNSVRCDNHDIQ